MRGGTGILSRKGPALSRQVTRHPGQAPWSSDWMFSASCKAELPPSDGLSFGVGHEHSLQLDECQLWNALSI